jgi:hypothetical protein
MRGHSSDRADHFASPVLEPIQDLK